MSTPTRTDFDTELRRHNEVLRQACGVQFREHILDIGCGTGQTTRQAAHTAKAGSALGVDVCAPSIERAHQLARAAELRNVSFERADAQTYRFPQEHFDVAISRFGTMFFDDPAAAFGNIRRALRPGGRLVMMVWQAHEHNEWIVAIHRSLEAADAPVPDACAGLDPFSLADPSTVTETLEAAGFTGITFTDIREPVYYGPDIAAALDWIRGFTCTSQTLKQLNPIAAARTVRRLRETLAAHTSDDGVRFNSRAWIVAARRRPSPPEANRTARRVDTSPSGEETAVKPHPTQTADAGLVTLLERAYSATAQTLQAIPPHRLERASPCEGWTVRQVGNHLVETLDFFARLTSEAAVDPAELTADGSGEKEWEHLGNHPAELFRDAAQRCLTGFRRRHALERVFPFPFGPTPGLVIANISLSESLIHGWDIARGAGLPYIPDNAVVDAVAQFQSHSDDNNLRTDGMFGPPQQTSPDASPFTTLLAFLGRQP